MQKNISISFLSVSMLFVSSLLVGMEDGQSVIPFIPLEKMEKIAYYGDLETFGRLRSTCKSYSHMSIRQVERSDFFVPHLKQYAHKDTEKFNQVFGSFSDEMYTDTFMYLDRAGYDLIPIAADCQHKPEKHIGYFNGLAKIAYPEKFFNNCIDESCNDKDVLLRYFLLSLGCRNILGKMNPDWFHVLLDRDGNMNDIPFYQRLLNHNLVGFEQINRKDAKGVLPIEYIASMNNYEQSVELAQLCSFHGMKLTNGGALSIAAQRGNVPLTTLLLHHKRHMTKEQLNFALIAAAEKLAEFSFFLTVDEVDNLIKIIDQLEQAGGDMNFTNENGDSAEIFLQKYHDDLAELASSDDDL